MIGPLALAVMTGRGSSSAVSTIARAHARGLEAQYSEKGSVYRAAAVLGVDDVIEPADTRRHLTAVLDMACGKRARQLGRKVPLFP